MRRGDTYRGPSARTVETRSVSVGEKRREGHIFFVWPLSLLFPSNRLTRFNGAHYDLLQNVERNTVWERVRAKKKKSFMGFIAGVAEKKSSFPFSVCSYPRVVHLAFLAPSSCTVSAQRPVKGLVVASVRGPTLMIAS